MRVTQRMLVDRVLSSISTNSQQIGDLQAQLASGKRLRKPSDDPQSLGRALAIKDSSNLNAQYRRNISTARGWLEAADSSLDHMAGVLTRSRDLALRGVTDSLGVDDRAQLAKQVDGLLEELLQSANASHQGQYLFSGRKTTTMPFATTRTGGQITAVAYRAGDPLGELRREIAAGVEICVNIPGDEQVGGQAPMQTAAAALLNLRDWLNGVSTASADVEQITTSLEGIVALRASVGARLQRVDGTEEILKEEDVNLSTMLSRAQDADAAEVMTRLTMQETLYRASLSVGARLIQPSLLDFLR